MALAHPPRSRPRQTPADYDLTGWEEVHFPAADGLQLVAWFIPPNPAGDGATLVCVHGLNANRSKLLPQAALLAKHGYGALLLDLRNHGQSEGQVTTLGYTEVEDVKGAVAYLLTRPEVNPQRIGLMGHSMGGATVIRAAARLPEVKVVVAESAYSSLEDLLYWRRRERWPYRLFPLAPLVIWFGQRATGVQLAQVRPIDDLAAIAPRPILFMHGERDHAVPAYNSRRMYEAAAEPKALYIVDKAYHDGLLAADPLGFEQRVVGFLDTYLRD